MWSLRIFSAAISIILIISHAAYAIPTFGTLMPKKGEFHGGYRSDFVFNRDVDKYGDAELNYYSFKMSYGFADWFCFDGMIGMGGIKAELTSEDKLRYPFNFAGGYGWRAKIYEDREQGIDWVWGFQHISVHPSDQWYFGRKHKIIWDEWQMSSVASKKIWRFTPYIGMKWSFIYMIGKIGDEYKRRISDGSPVGLVAGTHAQINDYIYLDLEGRFFDETAFNAGFTVRY